MDLSVLVLRVGRGRLAPGRFVAKLAE